VSDGELGDPLGERRQTPGLKYTTTEERRNMGEEMNFDRARENQGELAAWMLHLVDESPDKLGIIEIPHDMVRTAVEINQAEEVVSREFDRAKRDRPNLSVKITPPTAKTPNAALLIHVHEHHWIGGHCIHGCPDERDA
jgi:hypothetical protein